MNRFVDSDQLSVVLNMGEKPRGRGRGRGISSDFTSLEFDKSRFEESSINNVIHKLDILLLGGGDDDQIENVVRLSKSAVKTKEDVHEIATSITNACLTNDTFIKIGCKLCAALFPVEAEGEKFKAVIFNYLQKEFEDRNKTRERNPKRFLNSVNFICQFYENVRLPNNIPYNVFAAAIIIYMKMLLTSEKSDEYDLFVKLFQKHGRELNKSEPVKVSELITIFREKIIEKSTPTIKRVTFLRLFELYLVNWKPLATEVEDFYKQIQLI